MQYDIIPRRIIDVFKGCVCLLFPVLTSVLQFQRALRNWYWHSSTASRKPRKAARTWCGNLTHNRFWCALRSPLTHSASNFLLFTCANKFRRCLRSDLLIKIYITVYKSHNYDTGAWIVMFLMSQRKRLK